MKMLARNEGDILAVLGLTMLGVGVGGTFSVWAAFIVVGLIVMVVGGLLALGSR